MSVVIIEHRIPTLARCVVSSRHGRSAAMRAEQWPLLVNASAVDLRSRSMARGDDSVLTVQQHEETGLEMCVVGCDE